MKSHMKRFKFRIDYSGFGLTDNGIRKMAKGMEYMAQKAVKEQFDYFLLSKQEIVTIVRSLRHDRETIELAKSPMWRMWYDSTTNLVFCPILEDDVIVICLALEEFGRCREDFRLMNRMISWYGVERERIKVLKDFSAPDTRERWNEVYDGPEMVFSESFPDYLVDDLENTDTIEELVNP